MTGVLTKSFLYKLMHCCPSEGLLQIQRLALVGHLLCATYSLHHNHVLTACFTTDRSLLKLCNIGVSKQDCATCGM